MAAGTEQEAKRKTGRDSGAPRRLPLVPTILALSLLLFGCLVLGALIGDVALAPGDVARSLLHSVLPFLPAPDELTASIMEVRLPRVLLAALVGGTLSAAGVALQGLLGNPLADPYTVGVSSGAAVGAGIAVLTGFAGAFGGLGLALAAFLAALLSMALVFSLARVGGRLHTASFLLAGIVAGSFLWAITTLLLSLAQAEQRTILQFLTGRFNSAEPSHVLLLAPFTLAGIVLLTLCGRGLDAFAFGEEVARSVGVEVERFKAGILALAALLTAVAVAVSGIIGFVGLIVPHAGRGLVGPPHRGLVPVAALLGASLTVLADLLARVVRPGEEIPVGVVTALLGAPFFLVLMRRQMGA
jgi:iron complex transport system permease protein